MNNHCGNPVLSISGDIATIKFDREVHHNRLDPSDLDILLAHLEKIRCDNNIKTLVITGSGAKTFCSGYTLGAIKDALDDRFERVLDEIESLPIPVICALNGSVYGGAIDLALCCDIRIGVHGSKMFMPAAKFGLHYYPGGLRRFVTVLGLSASKKMFLTAKTIFSHEMYRINFLTDLVEPERLNDVVDDYIMAISECVPTVLATMKHDLNATAAGVADVKDMRRNFEKSLASEELKKRVSHL